MADGPHRIRPRWAVPVVVNGDDHNNDAMWCPFGIAILLWPPQLARVVHECVAAGCVMVMLRLQKLGTRRATAVSNYKGNDNIDK